MSKKKIKLYGIDIESDDDQEYVPDEQDISENNKNLSHHKTFNIDEIYQEMKKIDLYQPKVCTKTAQQIVREVLDEQNRVQVKRVKFAGKSFLINDKGEIQEENIEPVQTKQIKQPIGNCIPQPIISNVYERVEGEFPILQRSNQEIDQQSQDYQFCDQIQIRLEAIYNQGEVRNINGAKTKERIRCP